MNLDTLEGVKARSEKMSQRDLGAALAQVLEAFFGKDPDLSEIEATLMHRGMSRHEAERVAWLWARIKIPASQGG